MNPRKVAAFGLILMVTQIAFADASFQATTQITGGSMVDAMKQVSFFSKSLRDMFAPITTTTMVSGNRKVVSSKESIEITDLDSETITRVDMAKKTYTVMTFQQMRDMMKEMPAQIEKAKAQMAQPQAQQPKSDIKMTFDTSVKNTGVSKVVNGLMAQEQVITMNMHMTDPNAPANSAASTITYTVTTDAWIAPDPPEVKEIEDFDVRMAKKLMAGVDMKAFAAEMQGNGMAQMFAGKPGSAEAMAQMANEMAKLKGTRVLEVTSMGGIAPAGTASASSAPPSSGAGSSDASLPTSRLGALSSAIGSSALGVFHKKKAAPPADPPADSPATTASAAPGASAGNTNVVLMSTTTQKTNFTHDAVPASAFQIPAGFKQIPYVNPLDRMNGKK